MSSPVISLHKATACAARAGLRVRARNQVGATALGICLAIATSLGIGGCAASDARSQVDAIRVARMYGGGDSLRNMPQEKLVSSLGQSATHPTSDWWTEFEDSRLDQLVQQVLQTNSNLVAAGLRLKRARAIAGLASDELWPHGGAQLGGEYQDLPGEREQRVRSYSLAGGITYEADLWQRLSAQSDIAAWEAEASSQDLQATHLALASEACNLYWTIGFLNQRIRLGEQSIESLRRTSDLVERQFDAGAVSRLELLEAEQSLYAQATLQSRLVQQRVEARNAMTVLLDGSPWPQDTELQNIDDVRHPSVREGVPAELLSRRPDLRAAELRLSAKLRNIEVVRRSYYPAVGLIGALGGASADLSRLLHDPVGSLGVTLSLPFLRWKEMRLSSAIAAEDYEIAASEFRAALYAAFAEIDNALSARTQLAQQTEASVRSLEAALAVERLHEVRYRAGAVPLRAWLDAQEARRHAEQTLTETRLEQVLTDSRLYRALGGGTG